MGTVQDLGSPRPASWSQAASLAPFANGVSHPCCTSETPTLLPAPILNSPSPPQWAQLLPVTLPETGIRNVS